MAKKIDKIYEITKRNMARRSARDIPYVAYDTAWDAPSGSYRTPFAGPKTEKQHQNDRIFRKQGLGIHDYGDESPMDASAKRLKRTSGKSSPKR